mmetsp:Transcript_36427/g.93961  ORF Transcript_36427/g.93961 Transcript_36427/m.93961 type:complete len:220 (-) Transcript_36427:798-1457(-)
MDALLHAPVSREDKVYVEQHVEVGLRVEQQGIEVEGARRAVEPVVRTQVPGKSEGVGRVPLHVEDGFIDTLLAVAHRLERVGPGRAVSAAGRLLGPAPRLVERLQPLAHLAVVQRAGSMLPRTDATDDNVPAHQRPRWPPSLGSTAHAAPDIGQQAMLDPEPGLAGGRDAVQGDGLHPRLRLAALGAVPARARATPTHGLRVLLEEVSALRATVWGGHD